MVALAIVVKMMRVTKTCDRKCSMAIAKCRPKHIFVTTYFAVAQHLRVTFITHQYIGSYGSPENCRSYVVSNINV